MRRPRAIDERRRAVGVSEPSPPAAVVDAAWREGRLPYQRTEDGAAVWPPRVAAPGDGRPLSWHDSAGVGCVYATTALHARGAEPRNIALIDLDEGFRIMSRVDGLPAEAVKIGLRVGVRFTEADAETGARIPVFVPLEEQA